MLEQLREVITKESRPRRATTPSTATRIVTISLSERLDSLRTLQEDIFPTYPPELSMIRPWLWAGQEDFLEQCESDIRRALGLDIAAQFARSGVTLRRSSLIVVLGDTTDPDFEASLGKASAVLESVTARSHLAGHTFFGIGIFLVDSAFVHARAVDLQSLCSGLYAKVFLLDTRNPSGLELTTGDRTFQALHVLRYLERLPESCGSDEEFVEWIQSASPADGYCSSLGGSTVYYPVDAVLETACVQAGAKLLADSLLHVTGDDRHNFYSGKFRLDAGITSLGDVESGLAQGAVDPFRGLGPSTSDPDDDRALLTALESIDNRLDMLAAEQEAAMRSQMENRLLGWRHLLEEYLDAIVTAENGGLHIAAAFLAEARSHVQALTNTPQMDDGVPDPSRVFANATQAVSGLPSMPSLAVHALGGAGVAAYAALSGPFSVGGNLLLAAGAPAGILALAGLWGHAARDRTERCFADLRGTLSQKWEHLLNSAVRRVAINLLLDLCNFIDESEQEVQDAILRVAEAVEWFEEKHVAPVPERSTIYWPLLQSREELLEAASPIVEIFGLPPSSYLPKSSGRLLWRRLAQLGESAPNAYEWQLLEWAAVSAMSRCRTILDTRILLRLGQGAVLRRQVQDHVRLTAEPFLTVTPGTGEPETSAVLEADGTDCEGILRELEADLHPHFTRFSTVRRASPYLVSLTSLATRIPIKDARGLGAVLS